MNTNQPCELKLNLTMSSLAQRNRNAAELRTHTLFYETFAALAHDFFSKVVTSNSNWALIRAMGEDTASLANDCTMKFLMKLDYFLALPEDRRIKSAVVMANNLVRDRARSHQCRTKHLVTPDEYEWATVPDSTNIEKDYIFQEQSCEIISFLLNKYDLLSVTAFLGITVLRMKPAELSAVLSAGHPTDTIGQLLTDVVELMGLHNVGEIRSSLSTSRTRFSEASDVSAERLSDLCYETKRKLRKQFR